MRSTTRSTSSWQQLARHEDPLDREAVLPGVAEGAVDDGVGGAAYVGIGQHDDGAVAAELHERLLGARAAGDRVAGGVPAGERDHVDPRVADQRRADGGAATGQHGQPVGRHARVEQQLGEGEGGQGGLLRGLEDDAVAAHQGRRRPCGPPG